MMSDRPFTVLFFISDTSTKRFPRYVSFYLGEYKEVSGGLMGVNKEGEEQ